MKTPEEICQDALDAFGECPHMRHHLFEHHIIRVAVQEAVEEAADIADEAAFPDKAIRDHFKKAGY